MGAESGFNLLSAGGEGDSFLKRSDSLIKEFQNNLQEWELRCAPQKVNRGYFEGQNGDHGFLWDLFSSLRALGFSEALKNLQPKLAQGGNLPTKAYFLAWANLPLDSLKELSRLQHNLGGDHGKEANPAFRPLFRHFDNDGVHPQQRAEAGRFILLISEGCGFMLNMKRLLQDEGPGLLNDLINSAQTQLQKNFNPHHHLHNIAQRCWDLLQNGLIQESFIVEEYHSLMSQLIGDRKKHLAQLMVVLGQPLKGQKTGIQEVQLQLELQAHWSGMDFRGEAPGLKSKGDFREHLHTFQETLLARLQGLEIFHRRLESEMKQGGSLNSGLAVLLQSIHDLLGACAGLKSTLSPSLAEKVKKEQLVLRRLMNQLKNYQNQELTDLDDWPPEALTRYRYLEMECIRTFFLFNDKEVINMGRCIPHLFNAIQKDLVGANLDQSQILKKKLEDLITSTGRVLRKHPSP